MHQYTYYRLRLNKWECRRIHSRNVKKADVVMSWIGFIRSDGVPLL